MVLTTPYCNVTKITRLAIPGFRSNVVKNCNVTLNIQSECFNSAQKRYIKLKYVYDSGSKFRHQDQLVTASCPSRLVPSTTEDCPFWSPCYGCFSQCELYFHFNHFESIFTKNSNWGSSLLKSGSIFHLLFIPGRYQARRQKRHHLLQRPENQFRKWRDQW